MKIARLLEQTFIDYPGKIAGMVFTPGCNFSCPACHARQIIYGEGEVDEEKVFSFLESRKGWLEGLVICGGEPTLQVGLAEFARKVKEIELAVKLDTNGSQPDVLENLLKENLVDYVAMDVKGPRSLYPNLIGKEIFDFREFEKSLCITTRFPEYEFRTTIAPVLRELEDYIFPDFFIPEYMTPEEVADTAKMIVDNIGNNNHKYFLQPFVARSKEEMIDERLSKESLEKLGIPARTSDELMRACFEAVKLILPEARIRGED